uniref:Exocyst subunit Exo70 family protein n=1 Tax=Leersia perrieri TaxID=77586 RepID=A0A0D9WFS0_9ORYZ
MAALSDMEATEAEFSLPSWRWSYSYLDKIRSLSVVSASGLSSRSARSSNYSSTVSSTESGGSRRCSVTDAATCSFQRVVGFHVPGPRDIASQMVRDGFLVKLIGAFGRAPGPVLERWFSELDVGWLLRPMTNQDQEEEDAERLVWRWTRALTVMAHALSETQRHLQDERSSSAGGVDFFPISQLDHTADHDHELLQEVELRLARFVEATVSKMIAFAETLAAGEAPGPCPTDRFFGLMEVHVCISDVSEILMPSLRQEALRLPDSPEMQRLVGKIGDALSRSEDDSNLSTEDKLGEAIRRMAKDAEAVTPVLSGMDSWEIFPQNEGIHKTTQLIVDYASLFWGYRSVLESILCCYNGSKHCWELVQSLIEQMIINFLDQLEKKSELFADRSLRYIFLLNNSYFIQEQFLATNTDYSFPSNKGIRYWYYQNCYLDVSWEPVLSSLYLYNKMPKFFPKYSPQLLARFNSEFQKACKHQKLWKVPSAEHRNSLRKTISDKVITVYRKYLEGHLEPEKCSSDLLAMEDMVNELFEG